jgi:hypothetical protein
MNLKLTIPAAVSLAAFVGTMLFLNQSDGQQPDGSAARVASTSDAATASDANGAPATASKPTLPTGPLNPQQAKALLESYTAGYTKPWRDYAESPQHMMSRAMPRPIPSLYTRIEWASSSEPDNKLMLATIRISKGLETTAAPCVIDRETKQVRIFANDQWQTADEWVKNAPKPNRFGEVTPKAQ